MNGIDFIIYILNFNIFDIYFKSNLITRVNFSV